MQNSRIESIIESFRSEMPPVFELSAIDRYTGGAHKARTIHNLRSRQEIPAEIFIRQKDRKILVVRELFLAWWKKQLKPTM